MGKVPPSVKYMPCISTDDLPAPGSAICIAVDPKGSVFALGDKCPPVNQPLSFGKVNSDGTIQDPVLGTKFSLKTGNVAHQESAESWVVLSVPSVSRPTPLRRPERPS